MARYCPASGGGSKMKSLSSPFSPQHPCCLQVGNHRFGSSPSLAVTHVSLMQFRLSTPPSQISLLVRGLPHERILKSTRFARHQRFDSTGEDVNQSQCALVRRRTTSNPLGQNREARSAIVRATCRPKTGSRASGQSTCPSNARVSINANSVPRAALALVASGKPSRW